MSDCIRSTNLVLIPGMMCDERLWAPQVACLSGEYHIHIAHMKQGNSIQAIAKNILSTAPPTFALAGLSMGAIVAFEIWRQASMRVQRLALLDTNYRADAPERFGSRNRQIAEVQNGHLQEILRDELKPNYLAEIHKNNAVFLEEVLAMGMDLGADVFVRQSVALRDRIDSTHTLATIDCPVTIICGSEDQLCGVSLHEAMAVAIPKARLEVIQECGHLSTLEQPEAVNEILKNWLQAA
jgi:pimeloyl-ACP methyl ester carboxylesterase